MGRRPFHLSFRTGSTFHLNLGVIVDLNLCFLANLVSIRAFDFIVLLFRLAFPLSSGGRCFRFRVSACIDQGLNAHSCRVS